MSINFTANLAQRTDIRQRISYRNYLDKAVSVVELDVNNPSDMEAFKDFEKEWCDKGALFIHHMYNDAVEQHHYVDIKKEHYFLLTTQNTDLMKLKPQNILGALMFSEKAGKENEINWLEVKPETCKAAGRNREFKNVGRRLVQYVLNNYKEKDIFVQSAKDSIKFYKKMGAVQPHRQKFKKYQLYFRV